ncbi:hypothetical protein MKW98_030231 [Papaver atlanticum]|uniref:Uncharacterized protein n=1 Tax=Papaver atlanticum TaxID=357466 RepID=A0AAD4T1C8_9MAGN|nr:hypothetical protein MKW98_030231 [Papaver atlanticum]
MVEVNDSATLSKKEIEVVAEHFSMEEEKFKVDLKVLREAAQWRTFQGRFPVVANMDSETTKSELFLAVISFVL